MTKAEIDRLAALARQGHYYCEDSWYSCPKAEDGCADDRRGPDCDCGADEHNAEVDALMAILRMSNQEPAFPRDHAADGHNGMTLRDYFAAKAMQACIPARRDQFKNDNEDLDDWDNFFDIIADEAYGIADAMLAARERA